MRDLFFISIIIGSIPFILKNPRVGVLMWVWISIANPHRESYGWILTFPVLDIIAGATLVSVFVNAKQLTSPTNSFIVKLIVIFYIWCTLTTVFSVDLDLSFYKWLKFSKSLLIVFLILITHKTKKHVFALGLVIVLSISFVGIKGGAFTILTLGAFRVWGPDATSWGDNNVVSVIMLMMFPITIALARFWKKKIYRYMTWFAAFLFFITIFGTHSRGGLVGLFGIYILYAIRGKTIFKSLIGALFISVVALLFMPQHWKDRMLTIQSHQDQSAQTRLVQWEYAIDIANERPFFGNGFDANSAPQYQLKFLQGEIIDNLNRSTHSVYFEIIAEQGYIGLILFLLLGLSALKASNSHNISKQKLKETVVSDELRAMKGLAYSIQFGLAGYAANGVSVNIAYLDVYYIVLALLVCLGNVIQKEELIQKGNSHSAQKVTSRF